jgi:8-oxo-dGTP diphosphatase
VVSGLKNIPTEIVVVAAAITLQDGRILMQKRGPGRRHAGLWEFPGGKVEAGESPENALIREIEEELGLRLDPAALSRAGMAEEPAEGDFPAIVMTLYRAAAWCGEPAALQGQQWGWFSLAQAARLAMPAMDVALLERLRR